MIGRKSALFREGFPNWRSLSLPVLTTVGFYEVFPRDVAEAVSRGKRAIAESAGRGEKLGLGPKIGGNWQPRKGDEPQ